MVWGYVLLDVRVGVRGVFEACSRRVRGVFEACSRRVRGVRALCRTLKNTAKNTSKKTVHAQNTRSGQGRVGLV